MAKAAKRTTIEHFYFTVDDWCHTYDYGINRLRRDLFPGRLNEYNSIRIIGRLRNVTKRKIDTGELYLSGMDDFADRLTDDPAGIGYATVKNRHLQCQAFIPTAVFYSLPATLAAGKVTEFQVTVRNLRYSNGDTDSFSLHRHLSNLAEAGEIVEELEKEHAQFKVIDDQ